MSLLEELKLRNVFSVGIAYVPGHQARARGGPPNFAAKFQEGGLPWPPRSPIAFPLKDR
jgi:hypothetical protein